MPPKKAVGPTEDVDGSAVGAVTALCHLIMSCDEFKADNNKLAPILGIVQARNVPRKINAFVNPYGFELKGGKIVSQSDSQAQDGAAGPGGNTSAAGGGKDDKMKKAPKVPKPNTKARQGASKKRKLAASFQDEDENEHVKEEDGQEA